MTNNTTLFMAQILLNNKGNEKRETQMKKIFIVDSGKSQLKPILEDLGYNCNFALEPEFLIDQAKDFQPNLILGDFYEKNQELLINQLREDSDLNNTPIILCADKKNITTVIKRINGNVNDYLVKPFEKEEVFARIGRVIDRHEKLLNSNPLSHLPGNISIKSAFTKLNNMNKSFALLYSDLDNFKAYNDIYGYSKGDEVITYVARLLRQSAMTDENDDFETFVGHIGGDDFVVIRTIENLSEFCEKLILNFDSGIKEFFKDEDRKKGYITSYDRKGNVMQFPLMTISLAVVVNEPPNSLHYGEISLKGSEIKKYLKSLTGSNFLIDRRCTLV